MSRQLPDIETLSDLTKVLFFDTETSTHNKGHVYDPRNILVSYAGYFDNQFYFKYYTDPDFITKLSADVNRASVICGFNLKFDLAWLRRQGINYPNNVILWDLQLAEFILSGQELRYDSLDNALARYGLPAKKKDLIADYWEAGISTEDIPVAIVEEYNKADVYPALPSLYETQLKLLNDKQKRLVILEGEDLKALLAAEYAGIKFDVERANQELESLRRDIAGIHSKLASYLPADLPSGVFNWDSGDDVSLLLYGGTKEYKYVKEIAYYKSGPNIGQPYQRWGIVEVSFPSRFKPIEGSEVKKTANNEEAKTRYFQTDGPTLSQLKSKSSENKTLLALLQLRADKQKVVEMIEGIFNKMKEKNWQDNYIHGQFNQNVVITGRLSSSQPNLQNTPPEVDALLVSRYD